MYGWMGTILRVDLSSGKIEREPLSEELAHNYLGGRGINVRILYDEVKPGTDGLDPKNVLIFGTGPLTGTSVASGRLNITAMSPLQVGHLLWKLTEHVALGINHRRIQGMAGTAQARERGLVALYRRVADVHAHRPLHRFGELSKDKPIRRHCARVDYVVAGECRRLPQTDVLNLVAEAARDAVQGGSHVKSTTTSRTPFN